MTPLALTPPAVEPVSLSEAKDFLRILVDDEGALLETLITAARLMIEAASGRLLIEQGWRIALDAWPQGGEIRLPLSPVRSLTAARVHPGSGSAEPVAPSSLALVEGSDPPLILIAGPVPTPGGARSAIEIDLVAGFGATRDAVPAPLRQAVLRLACRSAARLPVEIAALVAPFRRVRL
jgi:uncharacterized phiE125 gp8 family phage protein